MTYTSPDLSQILDNEQLMNTRLTDLQTLLREILTSLDITYTNSNTVIELIRLLEKTYYCNIDSNATTDTLSSVFSEDVVMRNVAPDWDDNEGYVISFLQGSAVPNFTFSYRVMSESSGMVTAASLLGNKNPFKGYDNWKIDFDMIAPSPNYYETNRGMCVLYNNNSPVPHESTYYGFCTGITIKSNKLNAFVGKWDNTLIPTYTYSESTLTANETYHFNIEGNNGSVNVNVTDSSDNIVIVQEYDYWDDKFYNGGSKVRIGTYADWYSLEGILNGTRINMKNILVDY